jgi:hypothetical protein
MPLSEGVGFIAESKDAVAAALSQCTSVQEFLGVNNAADALEKIYVDYIPSAADGLEYTAAEYTALRPCIVVKTRRVGMADFRVERRSSGTQEDEGELAIIWYQSVPAEGSLNEARRDFENLLAPTINDSRENKQGLLQISTQLPWSAVEVFCPERVTDAEAIDEGDHWRAVMLLSWRVK